jgi:hypothetical protein
MTKADIKEIMKDFRAPKKSRLTQVDITPLEGLALSSFPKGKFVRKEVIVEFLRYQCTQLNGEVDDKELNDCFFLLTNKKVNMI